MFWIGVGVLIGGVILFGYGFLTVPNLFEEMQERYTHLVETAVNTGMGPSPVQILEEQLFLVQLLQVIGLGMAVLGAIMLAYGLWAAKENK